MSSSSSPTNAPVGLWSVQGVLPYFLVGFFNAFVDLGHKIVIQNTVFKVYEGPGLVLRTAIVQAMILLPFVLVFTPAGFISDKFAKDKVMRVASFAAIPIALLITLCYYQGWFNAAFALTFALALQSALYSPAKYGYVKELVGASNLAAANSVLQGLTIVAILMGTLSYTLVFEHFYQPGTMEPGAILQQIRYAGWGLVALCTVEFMMARRIPRLGKTDAKLRFRPKHYVTGGYLRSNLRDAWRQPVVRQSIIGLSVFWAVNQVLISSFGAWLKETSGETNTAVINGIIALAAIGIALGSWYAARMSRNFIETGLVPMGAAGLTLCLFVLPSLQHPVALGILFTSLGFFGGALLVPLNSLIQFHTKENTAGHIIASNNFVQTVVMLCFLGTTIALAYFDIGQRHLFQMLGFVTLSAALWSIWLLPQSLIRQMVRIFFSARYNLQVRGLNHVPAVGGVLFLGNHVSWLDWAFLQMACPRPIRFVMYRPYYEKWYLRWLLDRLQVIPISSGGASFALAAVREALEKGEAVALFPEGHISRNGTLSMFRSGFERAAAETGAQIVPFYLQGLWGSTYSFAAGKYKQSMRGLGARTVTVAFGAALDCNASAARVKAAVQELSIDAWSAHIHTMRPLAQSWLRTAKRVGTAPSVLGHDGVHFSGYKLMAAVFAFTPKLERRVRGQQRVGVLLPPSAGGIIATLALLLRGHSVVPLNYTSTPAVMQACIRKAGLRTVVTSAKFMEKLAGRGMDISGLRDDCLWLEMEQLKSEISKFSMLRQLLSAIVLPACWLEWTRGSRVRLDDTAAVLFSSGSEGTPKGVELTHFNMVGNLRQVSGLINPDNDDIMLSALPLFHAFGLTVTTLLPLIEGIPLVTQPDPTDAKTVGRLCAEHRVTLLCATGTFLRMYTSGKNVHPLMFAHLRLVVAGAEKLRPEVREQFRSKFGLDVFEGYGTTETTPVASVNVPDILLDDYRSVQVGQKPGTVGQPLPGSQFRIVDPDTLALLPVGQDGLVLIGGTQIMKGYLDDADRTAAAIVELDGTRWYRSGDKGHLDEDGFLTIVDRYSRFAKLGGEMVGMAAVEAKINAALAPLGAECQVVAVADAVKGEKLVVLYSGSAGVDTVAAATRGAEMPALWMPSRFLPVAELPRLGSGKADYVGAKRLALAEDQSF